ncbi:MAG: type I-E CRISPR-associated protein Cse1/CasA [Limnochordia bacterium]|jgi:CRISPR system Cascade subunit CasA
MNLLSNPVFRAQTPSGLVTMTLPALMTALGRDEVEHLVGIQRHQEDAFHVFLCYLAGAILARRGDSDPLQSEDYWLAGLRELAEPVGDEAWTLVVEDAARPAFMQPPLPAADQARLKPIEPLEYATDALDLLPTAKNHDVKWARVTRPQKDEWVYALVSLQTMSGFLGRGNYGISRMNSGFGNRAVVELVRSPRPGRRWCDAITRLLDHRAEVLAGPYGYDAQGLVLIWLEPWDGKTSLPLATLDPFYIEICRRVRLKDHDRIYAEVVPTEAMRIASQDLKGVVGDAWVPVDLSAADDKALTMPAHGVTAGMLRRLIFSEDLRLTPLQRPGPSWEGSVWLSLSVMIRGQGTTEGFHEELIPIPAPARLRIFGSSARRAPLADLSKAAIDFAGAMQRGVLRPAVFSFLEGGPDTINYDSDSAQAWWTRYARRFEALWSVEYFPWLWSVPEAFDSGQILREWAQRLSKHALRVLREAQEAMPEREGRRYRARVQSDRVFWGALYSENNFPFLREERHEHTGS